MKIDVMIPTYKPDKAFIHLLDMLDKQTVPINRIIVINTEEQYFDELIMGTRFLAEHKNLVIHHISRREFDHGKTRNFGASKSDADFIIFMTQDALPADEKLIENLLRPFGKREDVAVSYARQMADNKSSMVEKITREFNYPAKSRIKGKEDLKELGIKTYFCSNVCAAYRRDIFKKLGGFVHHTIFNEDMIYAANAVNAGYRIAYAADAKVIHSHNYTCRQQFKRNFDLGVSQADHPEIFEGVPSEKEGKKLVLTTIQKLKKSGNIREIFPYIIMSGFKFLGYRFGKNYRKLPKKLIKKWTMNPTYWK